MTPLPALPGTTQQGSKVGQCICDISWTCPRPSHGPEGPGEASLGGCFIEVQPAIPFWTSVLDSCFQLEPQVFLGPGGPRAAQGSQPESREGRLSF